MRRTLGITATAAAISMAAILPAGAQDGPGIDTYAAASRASAVDLTVFGSQFALADTTAAVDSKPFAQANGLAVLTPVFQSEGAPAATNGEPINEKCQELPIDLPVQAVKDLVCVRTSAKLLDGKPLASSAANEIVLEIKAPPIDVDVPNVASLDEIVDTVQGGLSLVFNELLTAAAPAQLETTQIEELEQSLQDILDGLLDEIQEGDVLVRITLAPSTSVAELTKDNLAASALSNGAVVELLPNLPDGALAVATIGSSKASVVRDAVTGKPTPTGHAALIQITYPNGLLGALDELGEALGQEKLGEEVEGVPDTLQTALSGLLPCDPTKNPLEGVICFNVGTWRTLNAAEAAAALGRDLGPTTVGSQSSILELRVLTAALPTLPDEDLDRGVRTAAPKGGIVLQLGETVAAAASTTPLPGSFDSPPTPQPHPRTGGAEAALPLTLGLLALGAGGAALLRRSRTI